MRYSSRTAVRVEPVTLHRLPHRYLAASYAENVPGIAVLLVAAYFSTEARLWASGWIWQFAGVLLVVRLGAPLHTWFSFGYAYTREGMWVSTGVLNRRLRFTPWHAVAAVQVDTPWCYRLFGVSHVTLLQGGDDGTKIQLPAVVSTTAMALVDLARPAAAEAALPEPCTSPDVILYRASTKDLVIASLLYGKFASVGVAGSLVALDALENLGALPALGLAAAAAPWLVALVAILLIAVWGVFWTVVRFAGLETVMREDSVVLRFGLLATRERVLSADAIVGVELRRNLLELALGRVRLSLVTVDSNARLGSNLVLPGLREAVAERLLEQSALRGAVASSCWVSAADRRRSLARGVLALVGTWTLAAGVALGFAALVEASLAYCLAVLVAALAVVRSLGTTASARLECDDAGGSVSVSKEFMSLRRSCLDAAALHLVGTVSVVGHAVMVRLHYYAGVPRVLTATRFEADDRRALSRAVARAAAKVMDER